MNENERIKQRIISTEELSEEIENPNYKIIDIRPTEAYNGWRVRNEPRGGHIKGSKSLPYKWSKYIDWIEIIRSKGILPLHSIIVYGYDKDEIDKVAQQFTKVGYQNVMVYYDFLSEWTEDTKYPMERLKRYRHLVSAEWVHELIETGSAPECNNTDYIICHAHYQNRGAYEKGHIPEAIELDTNLLESSETWNRRSPEELKNVFEDLGISHNTSVILYGRFSFPDNKDPFPGSSAGHLGAIRCAFIMMYAGVKDVRILNGGLQSWVDAGYETTTEEFEKKPVKECGISIPDHPEYAVDTEEAKRIVDAKDKNLVSIRSWREYIGEVSGYHYIKEKGRIPGSVFGNCGSDAYHMENYRNLDHTTREYHEIEEMWKEVGITPDKHNSFYCGTGWRGSEAFLNAWLMGWSDISVYDGGWFEWVNKGNPYETGIPTDRKRLMVESGIE